MKLNIAEKARTVKANRYKPELSHGRWADSTLGAFSLYEAARRKTYVAGNQRCSTIKARNNLPNRKYS